MQTSPAGLVPVIDAQMGGGGGGVLCAAAEVWEVREVEGGGGGMELRWQQRDKFRLGKKTAWTVITKPTARVKEAPSTLQEVFSAPAAAAAALRGLGWRLGGGRVNNGGVNGFLENKTLHSQGCSSSGLAASIGCECFRDETNFVETRRDTAAGRCPDPP